MTNIDDYEDEYGKFYPVTVENIGDETLYAGWLISNIGVPGTTTWQWEITDRHWWKNFMRGELLIKFRRDEDAVAFKLRFKI